MSEYVCVKLGRGWDSWNVMAFRSLGETTGPVVFGGQFAVQGRVIPLKRDRGDPSSFKLSSTLPRT